MCIMPRMLCMSVSIVEPIEEGMDEEFVKEDNIDRINKWKFVAVVCERFFALLYLTALLITLFGTICTLP